MLKIAELPIQVRVSLVGGDGAGPDYGQIEKLVQSPQVTCLRIFLRREENAQPDDLCHSDARLWSKEYVELY